MAALTYATLEHVAMQGRPYPTDLLEDCETGLVLFAAAFLGHNDAIHFAEAGIETWCVDNDGSRLGPMSELYPDSWTFINGDAWEKAKGWSSAGYEWDAVSCDTFTGEAMDRSLASLDLWCSLARKVVTVTLTAGAAYSTPMSWMDSLYERASGVFWLVLTREDGRQASAATGTYVPTDSACMAPPSEDFTT